MTEPSAAAENPQSAWEKSGFATRALHVGSEPDQLTGAVIPPVHMSTTFKQDGVGGLRGGYEYSRSANPTRDALQACLASLEHADRAFSFASGLAAQDTLIRSALRPGDHVLIPEDAYGGTYRQFDKVATTWGVSYTPVDCTTPDAVRAAITPTTRMVWVETPSNPLLSIVDIAAIAEIAHAHDALLVVDNTFATPFLQNPLQHGADVVTHSTTKYIGGHSDVVGGAIMTNADVIIPGNAPFAGESLADRIEFHQNAIGAVSSPFDAWLTLRGVKTLAVRMAQHTRSATAIVEMLANHAAVTTVMYPTADHHPGAAIAGRQMTAGGGMVSFCVADAATAQAVCQAAQVFTLAESLGGVESLIEHPAAMTHASASGSALEVPDTLIRCSVGLEDTDDLLADLADALAVATRD